MFRFMTYSMNTRTSFGLLGILLLCGTVYLGTSAWKGNLLGIASGSGTHVESSFTDVATDSPYAEAIFEMKRQKILGGYPDNTFKPEKVASRVEALKLLFEASPMERGDIQSIFDTFKQEKNPSYVIFKDIQVGDWFSPYIYKAWKSGLIKGNTDGTFDASRPITFAEFLKMMLLLERESVLESSGTSSPFTGVEANQWYSAYFTRAKDIGLLPLFPTDNSIDPNEPLSRAKIAQLLFNYRKLRTLSAQDYNGSKKIKDEAQRRYYLEDATSSGTSMMK